MVPCDMHPEIHKEDQTASFSKGLWLESSSPVSGDLKFTLPGPFAQTQARDHLRL